MRDATDDLTSDPVTTAAEGPSGLVTSSTPHEPDSDAPQAVVTEPVTDPAMEAAIEAWFARHFHGLGPRLDTPLYNLMHAAKEDLRRVLAELPIRHPH